MVVICFLKAKYHILKARNAQAQKVLGTKRECLLDRLRYTRAKKTLLFTYTLQLNNSTNIILQLPLTQCYNSWSQSCMGSLDILDLGFIEFKEITHACHVNHMSECLPDSGRGVWKQPFSKIQNIHQPLLLSIRTVIYFSFNFMLHFIFCKQISIQHCEFQQKQTP